MEEERNLCVFQTILNTCVIGKVLSDKKLSETQISTIGVSSKERKDNFVLNFDEDPYYHKVCYADYTLKLKIKRHLDKQNTLKEDAVPSKRLRRYGFWLIFLSAGHLALLRLGP